MHREHNSRKKKRPLNHKGLRDFALRYVARYATSSRKLANYLHRKIRERGWQDADNAKPDQSVDELVAYCTEKGFVNDALYAEQKARDLTLRGYGRRRVDDMLYIAGIDDEDSNEAKRIAGAQRWHAALVFARRKRIGPFAGTGFVNTADRGADQRKIIDKHIASMLRAGHELDIARTIAEATNECDLRQKGEALLDEALDSLNISG